jgi:hypothetical protein
VELSTAAGNVDAIAASGTGILACAGFLWWKVVTENILEERFADSE